MAQHPDYPVVSGEHSLDGRWSLDLPLSFNRRVDEGCLVLWRDGITIWAEKWGNEDGMSIEARIDSVDAEKSLAAFDVEMDRAPPIGRISYRLTEQREEGTVHALYAFAFTHEGHMELAVYCDAPKDLELARTIVGTLTC